MGNPLEDYDVHNPPAHMDKHRYLSNLRTHMRLADHFLNLLEKDDRVKTMGDLKDLVAKECGDGQAPENFPEDIKEILLCGGATLRSISFWFTVFGETPNFDFLKDQNKPTPSQYLGGKLR